MGASLRILLALAVLAAASSAAIASANGPEAMPAAKLSKTGWTGNYGFEFGTAQGTHRGKINLLHSSNGKLRGKFVRTKPSGEKTKLKLKGRVRNRGNVVAGKWTEKVRSVDGDFFTTDGTIVFLRDASGKCVNVFSGEVEERGSDNMYFTARRANKSCKNKDQGGDGDEPKDPFRSLTALIKESKLESDRKRVLKRFKAISMKFDPRGQDRMADTLLVLTEKQLGAVDRVQLGCWVGGGSPVGTYLASAGLDEGVARGINTLITSERFHNLGRKNGLDPCEVTTLATIFVLEGRAKKRSVAAQTYAASQCAGGRIGLAKADKGYEIVPNPIPTRLQLGCIIDDDGTGFWFGRTPDDSHNLRQTFGKKFEVSAIKPAKPNRKPKLKIKTKLSR